MLSSPGLRTINRGAPTTWITCSQCGSPVLELSPGEVVYPAQSAGRMLPGTRTRSVSCVCKGCGAESEIAVSSRVDP